MLTFFEVKLPAETLILFLQRLCTMTGFSFLELWVSAGLLLSLFFAARTFLEGLFVAFRLMLDFTSVL